MKPLISPGVYPGLSNEDYHGSQGMSKTKLDLFSNDPSALEWVKNCPVDDTKLKTLDFGDAMHAICLEPDRLKNDFAVMPKIDLRTNKGKEARDEFVKENAGKAILTADEFKKLTLMFDSVMAHPYARMLLESPGISEQSYYWTDPTTGVLCKCRPDRNIFNTPLLCDIKTTESLRKFKFSIEDYRYYVQSPFYSDGVTLSGEPKSKFVFLVIQKTIELGRYPVRCEVLSDDAVSYGRKIYKQDLYNYAIASDRDQFDGIFESELSNSLERKISGY